MSGYKLSLESFLKDEAVSLETISENWDNIPCVNTVGLDELTDGFLVKFQGMVQDMYTPEYYLETYEVEDLSEQKRETRHGKYKDLVSLKDNEKLVIDSSKNVNQECQTVFVINLPGVNDWTQMKSRLTAPMQTAACSSNISKRKVDDGVMETSNVIGTSVCNGGDNTNKKLHNSTTEINSQINYSPEFLLNHPIVDSNGKACLVKFYDGYDNLKINDMLEIVGFLAVNPLLSKISNSVSMEDGESNAESVIMNPPPSLIPRIHCVATRKISHVNPLLPKVISHVSVNAQLIREELHFYLSQILLGDKLAADYLICHLISRVYLRQDLLALGQCSLNISNVPTTKFPTYIKKLYEVLQNIVTKSHYFAMTLDNMNSISFTPKKDYECNRLTSGLLQLSANTHLVVDESCLQAGKLNEAGVLNVQALAHMIKTQRVYYDFKFYKMEYDTDVPVLILSEGKSLLPSDVHISLCEDKRCSENPIEIIDAAKHYLNTERLNSIRSYLTVVRHASCELSDSIQEIIQQDFVDMRKNDAAMNSDSLHKLLVLARLLALSNGETEVSKDSWKKALSMEQEIKLRNKLVNTR